MIIQPSGRQHRKERAACQAGNRDFHIFGFPLRLLSNSLRTCWSATTCKTTKNALLGAEMATVTFLRPPLLWLICLSLNRLVKKEPLNSPCATNRLGLGSATVPVAAVGVPPTAFRGESFRPEAESGGRDARAPKRITPSGLDSCRGRSFGDKFLICSKAARGRSSRIPGRARTRCRPRRAPNRERFRGRRGRRENQSGRA